jgi:hypothetical protein
MYWSACQSTGADIKKYLTAAVSADCKKDNALHIVNARLEQQEIRGTYGCRLAEAQQCCRVAGFAGRPDLIRMSRARQIVPGAAACWHDGRWDTCCAATRSCVGVLELGASDVAACQRWNVGRRRSNGTRQVRKSKTAHDEGEKASDSIRYVKG